MKNNYNLHFQIGSPVYVVLADNKVKYGTITDIEQYNVDHWDDVELLPEQFYRIELENGTTVFYTNLDINHTIFAALLKYHEPVEVIRYYDTIADQPLYETAYVESVSIIHGVLQYHFIVSPHENFYATNDAVGDYIFPLEDINYWTTKFNQDDLVFFTTPNYVCAGKVVDYIHTTNEYKVKSGNATFILEEKDLYSTYEEAIQN